MCSRLLNPSSPSSFKSLLSTFRLHSDFSYVKSSCGHLMLLALSLAVLNTDVIKLMLLSPFSGLISEPRVIVVVLLLNLLQGLVLVAFTTTPLLGYIEDIIAKELLISFIISSATGKPNSFIDLTMDIESSKSCVCKVVSRAFTETSLSSLSMFGAAFRTCCWI
ncbi:unnamed protein product [Cochlearia groenlandica]